ncbi:MAG: flagellar biosynthesis protein FlhA [Zetaproteobacteria bacterium]|nr:flagellar biosynthesis protein FlhA [Pseudobdellovibrionaceae bacterium]|tara:strand:- start:330 stop:2426 length:2097 start_codon:yes stop_codon:yes gene_type:complete
MAAAEISLEDNTRLGFLRSPDVQLAIGIIGIIFTMIMPLPPLLLDLLLTISITAAFLVLMISIYVKEPLEFSTFPTVLLITTLFRLGLNVATTRSILLGAPTGGVSDVIASFGNFVVGGNVAVGFVIFVILVIINFIVITKGAGRVAEVGARFTLDAMPGKQMAIDAELNAGLIEREEAKSRRIKIERESDFYGSMDGASKFVRGDAIAGIIITAINIIVGLIVGVVQYDMSFGESAQLFTLLTVGDGLVSQIPALIISTAAGIVVTRAGGNDKLSENLSNQIGAYPKALYLCSALLAVLAIIPGLPFLPFVVMSGAFFYFSRLADKRLSNKKQAVDEKEQKEIEEGDGAADSVENLLHLDTLALEVGVGLIPLVDTEQDGEVLERIISARKQFAQEMGIIVPMVMVRDNVQLKPGEYQVLLKGNSIAKGALMVDYSLAMDPGDVSDPIDGIPGKEPAYGLDATWIKNSQKDEAAFRGYTVVNTATVIVTHLTKIVDDHAAELLGRQEAQSLIDGLKQEYPKVVEEVLSPDRLSLGDIVKVLQNLLAEKVSIRDLLTVFETIGDYCKSIKNPDVLTRYVRKGLGRGIIGKYLSHDEKLLVITLDRAVEDLVVSGIQHREDGSSTLQLEPEIAQQILNSVAAVIDVFQTTGTTPIILCGSLIRWDFRHLIARFVPGVTVLAFDEIPQGVVTESVGVVTI